jgi:hypothetical protein
MKKNTTKPARSSKKPLRQPSKPRPHITTRGTFSSYAEYQAAREANPSEADLRVWERSAKRGLKGAALGSQGWRECMSYIVACEACRRVPGLSINMALDYALERVNQIQFVVVMSS